MRDKRSRKAREEAADKLIKERKKNRKKRVKYKNRDMDGKVYKSRESRRREALKKGLPFKPMETSGSKPKKGKKGGY